ncbi:MAG TPA: hypothetical protein VFI17_14130 [Solirubrobacterales bacterium]|nr:hypothetical protein [Solirubrobacterales bacterium]
MANPKPRAIVLGSLALFVALFVLLTVQLSASASSPGASHRKSKAANVRAQPGAGPEPEAGTTDSVESEYVEPEYVEPEYVEPEYEEAPPVVTTSS